MLSAWRKKKLSRRHQRRGRQKLQVETLESRQVLSTSNLGAVSGSVFVDQNASGAEDPGEAMSGAQVELFRANSDGTSTSVGTATTDANGDYTFGNLAAGDYFVHQPQQIVGATALSEQTSATVNVTADGVQGTVIDEFSTASGPTFDVPPPGTPVEENHVAPDAIGDERDFLVEIAEGPEQVELFINPTRELLIINPQARNVGHYVVTWDGQDQPGLGVQHRGLRNGGPTGVDLTAVNGVTGQAIGICIHNVFFNKLETEIRFRVYTDETNFSEAIISNIPEEVTQNYFIPFEGSQNGIQFVTLSGNGADFTNVGAVRLEVNNSRLGNDGEIGLLNALAPSTTTVNMLNEALIPQIDVEKSTNGFDADNAGGADVPVIAPGNPVTWTYDVSNTGEAPFTSVQLTDDRLGPITNITQRSGGNQDNVLDPGETWTYQATGTANAGAYENEATVVGTTVDNQTATDSDLSHYVGAAPSISIEKLTNGVDADDPADAPLVEIGAPVTWTYRVTNIGTIDLTNVEVSDDRIGPIANLVSRSINDDAILQPGEVWEYTASGFAQSGLYANKGTATANSAGGAVMAMDMSHYLGSQIQIDIVKSTNGNRADQPTDPDVPEIFVGQVATFTYVVTNPGTVPITNVVVFDDNGTPGDGSDDFSPTFLGGDIDNDLALDVGEAWTYSATRRVTTGLHTNVATVTGRGPNQEVADSNNASNHVGIEPPPVAGKRGFLASTFP